MVDNGQALPDISFGPKNEVSKLFITTFFLSLIFYWIFEKSFILYNMEGKLKHD